MRALVQAVILHERISTTEARAKLTRPVLEKMITRGKKQDLAARRILLRDLKENAVRKIFEVLAPRYQNRPGGYSRILHDGKFKDGTKKVLLELIK